MEFKKLMSAVALMGAMFASSGTASAQQAYYNVLTATYGTKTACYVCHDTTGKSGFTTFGTAFSNIAHKQDNGVAAYAQLDATYGAELTAGTLPQASSSGGAAGGGGGCVTDSIATPLTMALAMLTLGFFVRRKKD